jgi:hypothetical protein
MIQADIPPYMRMMLSPKKRKLLIVVSAVLFALLCLVSCCFAESDFSRLHSKSRPPLFTPESVRNPAAVTAFPTRSALLSIVEHERPVSSASNHTASKGDSDELYR